MFEKYNQVETMMQDVTQSQSKQMARISKKIQMVERRAKGDENKEVKEKS